MHQGDAPAADRAAGQAAGQARLVRGQADSEARAGDRRDQRDQGHAGAKADLQLLVIGQHGHEMGGPDAGPEQQGRGGDPAQAQGTSRPQGAAIDPQAGDHGNDADQSGPRDQAQIVLLQTRDGCEH